MKERPILFSAPMVRAILAGQKTQTRRVVKPQPRTGVNDAGTQFWVWDAPKSWKGGSMGFYNHPHESLSDSINCFMARNCPYGQPGDRLWVREAFSDCGFGHVEYRATAPADSNLRWTPSIHMPRWASRILLEVVSVRMERLRDITIEDAEAEGLRQTPKPFPWIDPVLWFEHLWKSINGPDSWDVNPWVWVVEFKRVDQ